MRSLEGEEGVIKEVGFWEVLEVEGLTMAGVWLSVWVEDAIGELLGRW